MGEGKRGRRGKVKYFKLDVLNWRCLYTVFPGEMSSVIRLMGLESRREVGIENTSIIYNCPSFEFQDYRF